MLNDTSFAGGIVSGTGFLLPALACVSILAAPLNAQTTLEAGPLVGYYRPVGHFDPASVYSTLLPGTPADLSGRAWGGNARLWLGAGSGSRQAGASPRGWWGEV